MSARPTALLSIGVAGMLAAAVARAVAAMPPWKWFDVDPLRSPGVLEGLGPSASLGLDALLLVSSSLVLLGVVRSGRRLDAITLLLTLLPVPVLAWHAHDDLAQTWRGSTLAASWIGLVAAAHLRAFPGHRAILFAGLLGCSLPWLARGAEQWFLDHPAAVAHFEANRAEILASFGWAEGSEAARLYERRLVQREMSGWFGLANVWSAVIAACAIAWLRLAVATRGRGFGGGTVLLAIALAAACLAGVAMNGSKGAIAALVAGLLFAFVAPRVFARREPSRSDQGAATKVAAAHSREVPTPPLRSVATQGRCRAERGGGDVLTREASDATHVGGAAPISEGAIGRLVLLAIPIGIAAIVGRGLLPEGFLSEKSLLFRWHYLQGAWWTFLQNPLGVGPAAFQEWYLLVKTPRSPESVQSAHSFLVDGLLAVGVLALAWIVALVRVLWRRGDDATHESIRPRVAMSCLLAAAASGLLAMFVAGHNSPALESMAGWIGLGLFVPAAIVAYSIATALPTRGFAWLLAAIGFTLLLQGQVEMTFFNQGSITWAMLMVGLAGSAGARPEAEASPPRAAAVLALLPAVLAMVMAVTLGPWRGAASAEARLAEAAAPLDDLGRRLAARGDRVDPSEIAEARRLAARRLDAIADAGGPAASHAGSLAVEQWLALSAVEPEPEARREAIDAALAAADRNLAAFGHSARRNSDRLRAIEALREADPDAVPAATLVEAIVAALALQPHDVSLHAAWGDACAEAGDLESARRAWRLALELDEALELDPLVQMPPSQRAAIEAKLAEAP